MDDTEKSLKILMVSLPFSGHTNPTLGLAKELLHKGCEVTYVHSPRWKTQIEYTGARFIAYDSYKASWNLMKRILKSWTAARNTVLRIGADYDCLVYEMLFVPGKSTADELGKPSVRLFSTFALNRGVFDMFAQTGGLLISAVLRCKPIYHVLSRLLKRNLTSDIPGGFIDEIVLNPPPLNLVYTVKDFQVLSDEFSDEEFTFVGPSIMPRDTSVSIDFAALKKPIIYISLGTLVNFSPAFYRKCFEAFGHEEVSVIMSIGTAVSQKRLGTGPSNFIVHPSVPQLEVLGHASLFITHGGMNSVNESLYYGVPMVVIPYFFDQPTIASRIEELHLGRRLSRKHISPALLRHTAQEVMHDEGIAQQVGKMRERMAQAGGNRLAADEIISFVRQSDTYQYFLTRQ